MISQELHGSKLLPLISLHPLQTNLQKIRGNIRPFSNDLAEYVSRLRLKAVLNSFMDWRR